MTTYCRAGFDGSRSFVVVNDLCAEESEEVRERRGGFGDFGCSSTTLVYCCKSR